MNRFYFDHNATTPIAPEVREALLRAVDDAWANPSSIHQDGQRARQLYEQSRAQVAAFLGAGPGLAYTPPARVGAGRTI